MLQKLKNILHLFESIIAAFYYGFPGKKLVVIGVTGTDGKTTTVNLIHHILTVAGIKACLWSTLSSTHTTTPGRGKLQKFLAQSIRNGCTHAVLEVSSHAIDQNRIWGINFLVGVLTNIANNEHLDYHKSFEHYQNTKMRFLKQCKTQIISEKILQKDYRHVLEKSPLLGDFNRANVSAAVSVAKVLGIDEDVIVKAVSSFRAPSGRLEIVNEKPFTIIVDFAHTPQAFEKVLPVARTLLGKSEELGKLGRLIHVFGCTGDRDRGKRSIMGEIAAKHDDVIILTSEDTYSERADLIIEQIEKGLLDNGEWTKDIGQENGKTKERKKYYVFSDRKEAIKKAIEIAKPGDVVIMTGVGHQKSMNVGGKEIPWNEQKIVRAFLEKNCVIYG